MKISFEGESASVIVNLLDEDAPNTCEAIWNKLPIRTKANHDIWSGHVIFLHLDPILKLPAENLLTYLPKVGDIFYYYRPPHYFRGAPYGRIEDSEIGIVYARDSRLQGPRGPKAVNVFATVEESGLKDLERISTAILDEGSKRIEIARG